MNRAPLPHEKIAYEMMEANKKNKPYTDAFKEGEKNEKNR